MKKLLLILVTLVLLFSCVPDDSDNVKFHVEFITADSVDLPESFTEGQTYQIKVNFRLPTDCHYFDGFYYDAHQAVRVVAVQSIVIEDANCESLIDENGVEQKSFNFYCSPGYPYDSYLFKFFTGVDTSGNQQFLEVEVPVVQ